MTSKSFLSFTLKLNNAQFIFLSVWLEFNIQHCWRLLVRSWLPRPEITTQKLYYYNTAWTINSHFLLVSSYILNYSFRLFYILPRGSWPTSKVLAGSSCFSPSAATWLLTDPAYYFYIFFPSWVYSVKSLTEKSSFIKQWQENIFTA